MLKKNYLKQAVGFKTKKDAHIFEGYFWIILNKTWKIDFKGSYHRLM